MKPPDPTALHATPQRTWLEATGQIAKFRLLILASLWIFSAWALGRLADALELASYAGEVIAAAGVVLFASFLLYPVVAIKCPKCKGKVLAHFMTHSPFHRWFADVQSASRCPMCGDDGSGSGAEGD